MANAMTTRQHTDVAIKRIRESKLLERLIKSANGEVQMDAIQAANARFLVNKFLPDLKAIEHSGDIGLHGDFTVNVK